MLSELPQTKVVGVKDFMARWAAILPKEAFQRNIDLEGILAAQMNLEPNELEKLAKVCDPSRLTCEDELRGIDEIGMLSAPELFSVDFILAKFPRTKAHLTYDYHLLKNHSELVEKELKEAEKSRTSTSLEDAVSTVNSVDRLGSIRYNLGAVLVVHVFVPFTQRHRDRPCFSQEILVLSSQTLSDLKDAIICPSDSQCIGEFSKNPDGVKNAPVAKDVFVGSYFYIENNFYNDFRKSDSDLSECVRDWMVENGSKTPGSYDMSETRFSDLNLAVGRPYLYLHLGNCEHMIVFADLRMISPDDVWDAKQYPLMLYCSHGRIDFCFLCDHLYARWIVYGSKVVIDDPCLLCDPCFQKSHYDENKQPIGDFQAFHFAQHS